MKNGMEVLAPAGDLKILKSAINAGADAVYFGGDLFGARASAKNFSKEDAKEALTFAHNRNKKLYLTVNTLLKNTEIERDLYDYMSFYYKSGIDGVIIQDFGVFHFLKYHFPQLELHASTQMNLSSVYGASFLKENGAKRIVTARELSLTEIQKIHKEVGIEIEAFVHGALCVCYSGNCLMSSFIGGRSGNRGRCAQPCRLPYKLCNENDAYLSQENQYFLSPKDLWGIHDLNRLYDAGVYSLKIEGRLKNEAYVTNVVSVYRKYVDRLLEFGSEHYRVDEKDVKRLMDAGNRGGFTRYYFDYHNHKDMMDYENSSFIQKNKDAFIGDAKAKKIPLSGEFIARIGEPLCLNVWDENGKTVELKSSLVEESKSRPTKQKDVYEKLSASGDSSFELKNIMFYMDENVFIPLKYVKSLRRDALAAFSAQEEKEILPYKPMDDWDVSSEISGIVAGVSKIEQLQAVAEATYVETLVLKDNLWLQDETNINRALKQKKHLCLSLPVVIRDREIANIKEKISNWKDQVLGFYVSSYDGLGLLEALHIPKSKVFFDQRLYTFSNRSEKAFGDLGYKNFYAPLELNEKELRHRINGSSELLVYGYVPLMYMANCVFQSTFPCKSKPESVLYLEDRQKKRFPVVNQCYHCTNVIYNSVPTMIFDEEHLDDLGMGRLRLDFTVESLEETKQILSQFSSIYLNQSPEEISFDYTRGHFKRGVN